MCKVTLVTAPGGYCTAQSVSRREYTQGFNKKYLALMPGGHAGIIPLFPHLKEGAYFLRNSLSGKRKKAALTEVCFFCSTEEAAAPELH
jgi:hypothetical protein